MKRQAANLRSAFQNNILTLPSVSDSSTEECKCGEVLRLHIQTNPPSSCHARSSALSSHWSFIRRKGRAFRYSMDDLRFEALKTGDRESGASSLLDDESYTYNKRVNHFPPAQHFMLSNGSL